MSNPPGLSDSLALFPTDEAVPVALAPGKLPSYIADHRARLRARFSEAGAQALPDYELLELLLFRIIPRQDVKPLARRLLDEFGDIATVLSAPVPRLEQVSGVGPAVALELKVVEAVAHRMARAKVLRRHVVSSWAQLLDYCHTVMAHREQEQFRVLYLDRKNVLIADEEQGRGTVDHVPVYPREVVKRALELNASAMIVVHNHPSGDPEPSPDDLHLTAEAIAAGRLLHIPVLDHIVLAADSYVSLRDRGVAFDRPGGR